MRQNIKICTHYLHITLDKFVSTIHISHAICQLKAFHLCRSRRTIFFFFTKLMILWKAFWTCVMWDARWKTFNHCQCWLSLFFRSFHSTWNSLNTEQSTLFYQRFCASYAPVVVPHGWEQLRQEPSRPTDVSWDTKQGWRPQCYAFLWL